MFFKLYALVLPMLLGLDMVWLGLVARKFYSKHLGFLMRPDVNWIPALIFYLIFAVGLVVFVLEPALTEKSVFAALGRGALFGFISYAAYDLTNQATVQNWPFVVTVVDLAWGLMLSAVVSVVVYSLATGFLI